MHKKKVFISFIQKSKVNWTNIILTFDFCYWQTFDQFVGYKIKHSGILILYGIQLPIRPLIVYFQISLYMKDAKMA